VVSEHNGHYVFRVAVVMSASNVNYRKELWS
jgi:hypothetical protein